MAEEKQKPLTREDVLRLIEENGGTAEGLDLSGKEFEKGIDLRGLNLKGIILKKAVFTRTTEEVLIKKGIKLELDEREQGPNIGALLTHAHLEGAQLSYAHLKGAVLWHAHLEEVDLTGTHLEKALLDNAHLEGASLRGAHLEDARLVDTHLEEADLTGAHLERTAIWHAHLEKASLSFAYLEGAQLPYAHLEGAYLEDVRLSSDTSLEDVDWGNYILGEEREKLGSEAATYRRLKLWYTEHGMYDIAGEFFFREMEAKRKALKWRPKPWNRAWSKFLSLICGYGERPLRVIGWAASVVLGLAAVYCLFGGLNLPYSLYYSAVSFTALGYGSWASAPPQDWVQGVGAAESFIGVFTIALFLITFVRK